MDNDLSARDRGGRRDEPVTGAAASDTPMTDDAGTPAEYPERTEPEYAPGSETFDPRLDDPSPEVPEPYVTDPDTETAAPDAPDRTEVSDDQAGEAGAEMLGGAAGAMTGAVAGAVVAGPAGAFVGGIAGAALGAAAGEGAEGQEIAGAAGGSAVGAAVGAVVGGVAGPLGAAIGGGLGAAGGAALGEGVERGLQGRDGTTASPVAAGTREDDATGPDPEVADDDALPERRFDLDETGKLQ